MEQNNTTTALFDFNSFLPKDIKIIHSHTWIDDQNNAKSTSVFFAIFTVISLIISFWYGFIRSRHSGGALGNSINSYTFGGLAFFLGIITLICTSFIGNPKKFYCAVSEDKLFYGDSKNPKALELSINRIHCEEEGYTLWISYETKNGKEYIALPKPNAELVDFLVRKGDVF